MGSLARRTDTRERRGHHGLVYLSDEDEDGEYDIIIGSGRSGQSRSDRERAGDNRILALFSVVVVVAAIISVGILLAVLTSKKESTRASRLEEQLRLKEAKRQGKDNARIEKVSSGTLPRVELGSLKTPSRHELHRRLAPDGTSAEEARKFFVEEGYRYLDQDPLLRDALEQSQQFVGTVCGTDGKRHGWDGEGGGDKMVYINSCLWKQYHRASGRHAHVVGTMDAGGGAKWRRSSPGMANVEKCTVVVFAHRTNGKWGDRWVNANPTCTVSTNSITMGASPLSAASYSVLGRSVTVPAALRNKQARTRFYKHYLSLSPDHSDRPSGPTVPSVSNQEYLDKLDLFDSTLDLTSLRVVDPEDDRLPSIRRTIWEVLADEGTPWLDHIRVDIYEDTLDAVTTMVVDVQEICNQFPATELSIVLPLVDPSAQYRTRTLELLKNLGRLGMHVYSTDMGVHEGNPMLEVVFVNVNILGDLTKLHEETNLGPLPIVAPREIREEYRSQVKRLDEEKPNACIFYLIEPDRLQQTALALESMFRYFNSVYQYPVILLHEDTFNEIYKRDLLSLLGSDLRDTIEFRLVPTLGLPPGQSLRDVPPRTTCNPERGTIGYRNMCYFLTALVHSHMPEYEWHLRLDTDSIFTVDVGYDIFRFMEEKGAVYGFADISFEHKECTEGLFNLARKFVKSRELEDQFIEYWDENQVFYNNFEISRSSLWFSDLYQDYLQEIINSNGIYKHRWGDAPIKTAFLSISQPLETIHHFRDLGYIHMPFSNKQGAPLHFERPYWIFRDPFEYYDEKVELYKAKHLVKPPASSEKVLVLYPVAWFGHGETPVQNTAALSGFLSVKKEDMVASGQWEMLSRSEKGVIEQLSPKRSLVNTLDFKSMYASSKVVLKEDHPKRAGGSLAYSLMAGGFFILLVIVMFSFLLLLQK